MTVQVIMDPMDCHLQRKKQKSPVELILLPIEGPLLSTIIMLSTPHPFLYSVTVDAPEGPIVGTV